MGSISELMTQIDNIKSEISDNDYLSMVNNLASIKQREENLERRIRKLKRQAFKYHYMLQSVTEYGISNEYDSDSGELMFIDTF